MEKNKVFVSACGSKHRAAAAAVMTFIMDDMTYASKVIRTAVIGGDKEAAATQVLLAALRRYKEPTPAFLESDVSSFAVKISNQDEKVANQFQGLLAYHGIGTCFYLDTDYIDQEEADPEERLLLEAKDAAQSVLQSLPAYLDETECPYCHKKAVSHIATPLIDGNKMAFNIIEGSCHVCGRSTPIGKITPYFETVSPVRIGKI